jgi:lipopolysaccharide/colanic/teichoic acid biosynthesis glycosyltransferase/multisubunit Na+/H+ antiporter MnhE subunit
LDDGEMNAVTSLRVAERTEDSADRRGSFRHLLRLRYQLAGMLIVAVFAPAFARGRFSVDGMVSSNNLHTMIGVAAASLLAYFVHRQLTRFPGALASSYVIPVFVGSFAAAMVVYFFFRIDYARSTFAAGFVLAAGWAYAMNVLWTKFHPMRLGFVPFGAAPAATAILKVEWLLVDQLQMPKKKLDGLVVDLRADLPDEWEAFVADAALGGTPVYHVKQIAEALTGRVEIEHLSENTLGSLNPNLIYLKIKQMADWLGAVLLLILLWPALAIVAIAIRLDSPGPALFRQFRRGHRGQDFLIYKFRTMRMAPAGSSDAGSRRASMTSQGDPRITKLGRFLRRTRLDELPQLFNILKGEMSWIGPRPEAVDLSDWYEGELPFYRYRHIVKPGITGWAQVSQGHVTEVDEVLEKLHYDFFYIKNFSPWLDLLIVFRTFRTVLTGHGAR